jgi:hypothetical protein
MAGLLRKRVFETTLALFWASAILFNYLQLTHLDASHPTAFVGGFDENSYFALTHSMLFDGDLNSANEFHFIRRTQPPYLYEAFRQYVEENPDNPRNLFPAGTSIAALPAMALVRAVVAIVETAHGQPYSGYSPIYVLAYFAANITYGALALWLCFQMLLRWFPRAVAGIACWAVALCTPFAFYFLFDPGMSHMTSAFFGTAAVVAWLRWRDAAGRGLWLWAFATGAAAGFAVCVRPYNAPLVLLLAERLFAALRLKPERSFRAGTVAVAALGVAVGFAPQLFAWRAMHGAWIANTDDHSFGIVPRYALHILFSRTSGLFFWTPAVLLAVVALFAGIRRRMHPALVFAAMFAGFVWMYGNWREWWLGVAFGMRGMDQVYLFAFGFAVFFHWVIGSGHWRAVLVCRVFVLLFALINLHLILAFRSGSISHDGPLYWRQSFSRPDLYGWQLGRDLDAVTPFGPGERAPLLMEPFPGVE